MAETRHERVKELYQYARKVASEERPVETSSRQSEVRLNATLKELENRLTSENQLLALAAKEVDQRHQISLEQAADPTELLRQRKIITAAYKRLASDRPILPVPESLLPRLIALQCASESCVATRELIPEAQSQLKSVRKLLTTEQKHLAAFQLLHHTLEERIVELLEERDRQQRLTADDILRERVEKLRAKENALHEEANELGGELKWFLKERLAPMLAAEKAGGPVVGDILNVTDEMLGAGFTNKGKSKSIPTGRPELSKIGKALRLDTYNELRRLMQDLLNAAADDTGDTDGWVRIDKESKAVQYLVTAKVASFHLTDARKLRLVDFGD